MIKYIVAPTETSVVEFCGRNCIKVFIQEGENALHSR